jgi:hypothetical protein
MLRVIASFAFIMCASHVSAQNCPDFFRFVDFGLEGRDGQMYRGGTILRAESFGGQPLLIAARTECLVVHETSKDGPGNPIPVVTAINYDPEKLEVDLTELRVFSATDTVAVADDTASAHLAKLDQTGTIITIERDFLCASQKETDVLSCQFVSPYPGGAVLVVHCEASECTMPVLAMNEQLVISATWAHSGGSQVEATGKDILQKIQQIHDFLDPLTSGL